MVPRASCGPRPGLVRELRLRFLLAIDGGEIVLADLCAEPERAADLEAGS